MARAGFNHTDLYQRGEYFTEQTVHTVTFKIYTYTYNGERRELWVNEVNNNGFTRLRRPEQLCYRLTGDHALSLRTSDYWRAFFHIPLQNEGYPYTDFTAINFLWRRPRHLRFRHWPLSYSSCSLVSSGFGNHSWNPYGLWTSCKLSLRDFTLWHPRTLLTRVRLNQHHRMS